MIQKFSPSGLLNVDFDAPAARALDWILAAASIAVGLWMGSVFWIVAGLFGLFLAWYRPIGRYQRYLRSTFIKKRK